MKEWAWTAWDSISIDRPDMTLKGLIDHLDEEYGLELSMLSHGKKKQGFIICSSSNPAHHLMIGVSILYSSFANAKKVKERMPMRITDIVELVTKKQIEASKQYITLEVR